LKIKNTLIETWLPVDIISRDAAIEMSFKPRPAYFARCKELGLECKGVKFFDPKIRSLHPWPARRPRSVCRAINLACVLPDTVPPEEFLKALGFSKESFEEILSRGYPPLISFTHPRREIIKKYNPECERLVILDPMAGGGSIPLEALSLGLNAIAMEYNPIAYLILKATIEFPAKYGIELYKRVKDETLKLIDWVRTHLKNYYSESDRGYIIVRAIKHKGSQRTLVNQLRLAPNVSRKLRIKPFASHGITKRVFDMIWSKQHRKLMTCSEVDDDLFLTTHYYAFKQVERGFTEPSEADKNRFIEAYHEFLKRRHELSLPNVEIPLNNVAFSKIKSIGLDNFQLLLNPRQALALGLVTNYIKQRSMYLLEKYDELGIAVSLYLALGVSRIFDFNSILTTWNYRTKTIRDSFASYFSRRQFILDAVYAEAVVPYITLQWIYEPDAQENSKTRGGILPVLKNLCEFLEGRGCNVKVIHGDALKLHTYFRSKEIDIIHVDPPYYDVHIYSDMSELPWNIVRTVLPNKILARLFKDSFLRNDWSLESSQVPRSHEIIARSKSERRKFKTLLKKFLCEAYEVLKEDGLLILWFSHKSWDAWELVIDSLFHAGFSVIRVYPIVSEHPARLVTRGGTVGFNRALVIVSRKRREEDVLPIEKLEGEVKKLIEISLEEIDKARITSKVAPSNEEKALFAIATTYTLITRVLNKEFEKAKTIVLSEAGKALREKGIKEAEFIKLRKK